MEYWDSKRGQKKIGLLDDFPHKPFTLTAKCESLADNDSMTNASLLSLSTVNPGLYSLNHLAYHSLPLWDVWIPYEQVVWLLSPFFATLETPRTCRPIPVPVCTYFLNNAYTLKIK